MHISPLGLGLIEHFETFQPRVYLCPAGYWTIGFGAIHGPDGQRCTARTSPVTRAMAELMLTRDCRVAERVIAQLVRAPLNQGQFDALGSFIFNVGGAKFKASTLLMVLNRGDFADVSAQLLRWTRGGARVLKGLVLRRQAEAALFAGIYHAQLGERAA